MDMKQVQIKLGLPENLKLTRKAQELQRLSNVHFNSSALGVGEICKAVLCFELACTVLQVRFDRQKAIRYSGLSEKAYLRTYTAIQSALGFRKKLDVRELAVQFGCVRLIDSVQKALALYQQRFVAALPEARRASADFNRPVFTGVAFFLCAKKHKLKVDKHKLIGSCDTSDSEFSNVSTSMMDLCFDIFGVQREKKDVKAIKTNRDLLDALPGKRKNCDDEHESDEDSVEGEEVSLVPGLKRSKKSLEKDSYNEWKASALSALNSIKHASSGSDVLRPRKQMQLNFSQSASVSS